MTRDEFDHAPLVKDWLDDPIWLPEGDTTRVAQLVHLTKQQHGWLSGLTGRSFPNMFTATKTVAAGVIIAAFSGSLLLLGALGPSTSEPLPAAVTAPAPDALETPLDAVDDTGVVVMDASDGQSVAGWTETGRLATNNGDGSNHGEMRRLQAVGDRLVVIGEILGADEGPRTDVIYHSDDGVSWVPAEVPGERPVFNDLLAADDGILAAGSVRVDGERQARIWSSADGIAWTALDAPPVKRINQIVSKAAPVAVRGGNELWADHGDGEWVMVTKLVDMPILRGPGGFLAWQFDQVATMIQSADLASGWTEVNLPNKLSKGGSAVVRDMQLFALDEQWVLIPHVLASPESIYTSPDGIEWTEAPRPPGILAGAVRWIVDVGDQAQAFGAVDGDDGDESGIWTFVPGEPVEAAQTMAVSDAFIDAAVAFGDGYAATGLEMGRGNWALTMWQYGADTPS